MLVNLEAKFDNKADAYNAARTADTEISNLETKIFDKWSLESYLENVYSNRLKNQILKSFLLGGILGALFGMSIKMIFNLENLNHLSEMNTMLSLGVVGFIIGAILLTTLLFIKREETPNLSVHDIKEDQSVAVFKLSAQKIKKIEEILVKNNALKVRMV